MKAGIFAFIAFVLTSATAIALALTILAKDPKAVMVFLIFLPLLYAIPGLLCGLIDGTGARIAIYISGSVGVSWVLWVFGGLLGVQLTPFVWLIGLVPGGLLGSMAYVLRMTLEAASSPPKRSENHADGGP